ncbi:MAG: hypothetical protein LBM66_07345 [Bifidobacteriaceae bacterium]|jgi:hypothetical protein|nr:hypothetical protein [Bifidobacteriaceae bacterium]
MPRPHVYDVQFGPFYDSAGVTALLGISRQALSKRAARGTVIRTRTADSRDLYPTFQFRDRALDPAVKALLRPFRPALAASGADGWAVSYWMTCPHPDLDGLTPLAWCRQGYPVAPAVRAASQAVAVWTAL